MGWIILGVIVGLIIMSIIASEARQIAAEKGFDESKYFWYVFLFGIIGLLIVCALPDRAKPMITTIPENASAVNSEELPEL